MNRTVSIDFDGVLHDYSNGWTGYVPEGPPIDGARDFVSYLIGIGYEVIISSCRAYTQIGREGIREWLIRYDFPFQQIQVTCEKPHAEHYIDDRAIRFEGRWSDILSQMQRPVWFKVNPDPEFGEK